MPSPPLWGHGLLPVFLLILMLVKLTLTTGHTDNEEQDGDSVFDPDLRVLVDPSDYAPGGEIPLLVLLYPLLIP